MRPVVLGSPISRDPEKFRDWVNQCFAEIELASQEDVSQVAADFTITAYTETRTLNGTTATLADVRNFVCTLVRDIKNAGSKRS
jgi:hypothetical protein